MEKFDVVITEKLVRTIQVESFSKEEALQKVEDMYDDDVILLDYQDLSDTDFRIDGEVRTLAVTTLIPSFKSEVEREFSFLQDPFMEEEGRNTYAGIDPVSYEDCLDLFKRFGITFKNPEEMNIKGVYDSVLSFKYYLQSDVIPGAAHKTYLIVDCPKTTAAYQRVIGLGNPETFILKAGY